MGVLHMAIPAHGLPVIPVKRAMLLGPDPRKGQVPPSAPVPQVTLDQTHKQAEERIVERTPEQDSMDASFDGEDDGPTFADRLADTRKGQHEHVAGLELKTRIQMALKQLSPELREAVILRDLEDMDYKEIAAVLKVPEGTVKSRISRGRGELARLLQRIEKQA